MRTLIKKNLKKMRSQRGVGGGHGTNTMGKQGRIKFMVPKIAVPPEDGGVDEHERGLDMEEGEHPPFVPPPVRFLHVDHAGVEGLKVGEGQVEGPEGRVQEGPPASLLCGIRDPPTQGGTQK